MLMHQNQTSFSSQKISPDKLRFAEECEKCGNKYQEKCKYASMINFIDKMLQKIEFLHIMHIVMLFGNSGFINLC